MSTNYEIYDTFCPYCGREIAEHPDTDIVRCPECDNPCKPVPFEKLEQNLQDEWAEDFD